MYISPVHNNSSEYESSDIFSGTNGDDLILLFCASGVFLFYVICRLCMLCSSYYNDDKDLRSGAQDDASSSGAVGIDLSSSESNELPVTGDMHF